MVVVANPVCGAVMDHTRSRKRFLFASYLLTIGATGLLYFVEPGWIITAVILIIVSNFAYAIGEGFISSFLPDLGPGMSWAGFPDWVGAWGMWAAWWPRHLRWHSWGCLGGKL